jgi:hypothetical protein
LQLVVPSRFVVLNPDQADLSSDVQFGQREAANGMLVAQKVQNFVLGAAGIGFLLSLFAVRATKKMASATIKKMMMLLTNNP